MQEWEAKIMIRQLGLTEGESRKLVTMICKKLQKGKTPEQIAEDLEESLPTIQNICEIAAAYAPAYDSNQVFSAFWETQPSDKKMSIMDFM